jgi:septum formation protein
MPPRIVLASTSVYRRELLSRLCVPFAVQTPGVDESPHPREAPRDTALRLAIAKARAVAARDADAVVIGSDQVADLDGQAVGKPGSHAAAFAQLQSLQGRSVTFHTALAVAHRGALQTANVPTRVVFRRLDDAALQAYLRRDTPYDCAGAARIESLGIALVERVESDDPTALIGLPLIRLVTMLGACGIAVPGS